ncbi:unnamed protein product, partial [Allacma fusca]
MNFDKTYTNLWKKGETLD